MFERKKKIIIFPNPHYKSTNPYLEDLGLSVNAINKDEIYDSNIVNLIRHIYDGEIYIFNWPEDLIFRKYGLLQFLMFIFSLIIIKLRRTKIIWTFHNITPHRGHNMFTKLIYNIFYNWSDEIITHSKKALNFIKQRTKKNVIYIPHPFRENIKTNNHHPKEYSYDIIIWGSIMRYKGILEFLETKDSWPEQFKILIVGKCDDPEYDRDLRKYTDTHINYINRYLDKTELSELIEVSRYVVFPYLKDSISSSGALIDSLIFGKTVIGPNVGAFHDLAEQKLCYTFIDYNDIFSLIMQNKTINKEKISCYINENTWDKFADKAMI